MKNFDQIIAALQSTSAERILRNTITEKQWEVADEQYGVFFNVETGKVEIWPNIKDTQYVSDTVSQNPVLFLGFIDVDTAITIGFEGIIENVQNKQQQQEEQSW